MFVYNVARIFVTQSQKVVAFQEKRRRMISPRIRSSRRKGGFSSTRTCAFQMQQDFCDIIYFLLGCGWCRGERVWRRASTSVWALAPNGLLTLVVYVRAIGVGSCTSSRCILFLGATSTDRSHLQTPRWTRLAKNRRPQSKTCRKGVRRKWIIVVVVVMLWLCVWLSCNHPLTPATVRLHEYSRKNTTGHGYPHRWITKGYSWIPIDIHRYLETLGYLRVSF